MSRRFWTRLQRAADLLSCTQPALSKTIATLEREMGAVLVE